VTADEPRTARYKCGLHAATSSVIGTKRSDYRENAKDRLLWRACSSGENWMALLEWLSGVS
jgi:hypothetical protein